MSIHTHTHVHSQKDTHTQASDRSDFPTYKRKTAPVKVVKEVKGENRLRPVGPVKVANRKWGQAR